jgi:hypothetical protein
MVLSVQAFEPLAGDVGVNGGGRNVRMTQKHLHRAQVRTVIEQMRGKRMAQGVR